MDYTKYLDCKGCQDSGLYCHLHRKEAEHELKKQELQNVLQIKDAASPLYKKGLKNLLASYNYWDTI